jgi:hypothetical protein
VKFLYYPSKFNQYIPEENLKIGNGQKAPIKSVIISGNLKNKD